MIKERKIVRIAITGPESTGKSTLCKQLAGHYKTDWVREAARDYINNLNRPYEKNDLLLIGLNQIRSEDLLASNANKILFCDTELLVIKIWSKHKFGTVDPFILDELASRTYDLYLLTDIDVPWVFDDQREHPDKREYFFDWFEKELISAKANYEVIQGNNEERFNNSIRVIDNCLRKIDI